MSAERHLIIQELILRPSGEWAPGGQCWMIARVAEGSGYWMQGGNARALNPGDGLVLAPQNGGGGGRLRASQLGPLKLEWFTVQLQFLNGLLTVAEWHQLEMIPGQPASQVLLFAAHEPLGQKFAHIGNQTRSDGLTMRCALLQFWASAVTGLLPAATAAVAATNKLRDRFREHIGQMLEAELSGRTLAELAGELHCSERHFSRLFREEFGVPLRARQIELRLQRARQLLADSNAKIISVAYDSGYRHLGLFNAMFKKRFGVTPSEWRQQCVRKNPPAAPPARKPSRSAGTGPGAMMLLAAMGIFLGLPAFAQTNAAAQKPVAHFRVDKYLVEGNSILSPGAVGRIFTNVPAAFGTNVTIDGILQAAGDLQQAYRDRGYMTVVVGLPPQKLTNAEVTVKVTEAPIVTINVEGNRYFSSNNVMRALPDLHTNLLLNAKIFQNELDTANMSRDRQIYPVVGPGPDPGTSELTLKVKDRLPWHARLEINNDQSTPGTPQLRVNFSSEYDNLWGLEHEAGVQYSFSSEQMRNNQDYIVAPFDQPQVANYSGYYRIPLGGYRSVQNQVNANPGSFGYNEATHQFNLPPPTGRPELTFFASRAVADTGVQNGPVGNASPLPQAFTNNGVLYTPLSFTTNSAGQNITLTEDAGLKLVLPLPPIGKLSAAFSLGADFKHFQQNSYNTNENNFVVEYFDAQQNQHIIPFSAPQPQATSYTTLNYLPLNAGMNGSLPDKLGTTFFSANANFNVMPGFSKSGDFAKVSYAGTSANANYVTLQLGADRVQSLRKDWSVKLHADGQWANTALIGNEQYAMGGTTGVRGYSNGEAYGDEGWRVMVEPQLPPLDIGMFGNGSDEEASWLRGSVFMDYGETYLLNPPAGSSGRQEFWGAGWAATVSLGSHLDARVSLAWPLTATPQTQAGDTHFYFGVGGQF